MLPCYKPSHEPNQVEKLSPNLAGLGLKEKVSKYNCMMAFFPHPFVSCLYKDRQGD